MHSKNEAIDRLMKLTITELTDPGVMPPDGDPLSLIEECTKGGIHAVVYLSRLGLINLAKDPGKCGIPDFKSVPEVQRFWDSTKPIVESIATQYKTRNAIRDALRDRRICLEEISIDCLRSFGHQVWNKGVEEAFVTHVDTPDRDSKKPRTKDNFRVQKTSKGKARARIAESAYPRHLIYEDRSDQHKIRLQVSAWIVQRACRKVEAGGKKNPYKARVKASTRPSSFVEAVRVNRDEPHRSPTLSSNDDIDELSPDYQTGASDKTKQAEQVDTVPRRQLQSSGASQNPVQTPAKRSNTKRVAVVVSPRKPWSSKTTRTIKRKPQRSELVGIKNTAAQSVRSNRKKAPTITQPVSSSRRTKQPRTIPRPVTSATVDDQVRNEKADESLGSMANQLLLDRGELGIQLLVLLESNDPGSHEIENMQKLVGCINTVALDDAERLRTALGSKYNEYTSALHRWLACMRTLVEFRDATGLSGNGSGMLAGFKDLPLQKKKAQRPYLEMGREIFAWKRDGMTLPVLCKEVGFILLEMASFAPLGMVLELGMELDQLLVDLIPFTTRLVECFLATPPNP
ncbi:hypothetical protein J4E91_004727 [Alternaria rosae]|nr:hypothetical protein J4E91_004727 [Alternaria rosae]